jgi:hypothetical protein
MWCRTTIVAATFAISSSGMAAELAKSGSIEGQVYIHTVQKIDELDAPDGMKAYINEEFEFHVPKQRGELLDGMSGRCLAYGKYSDAGAFKESGRCSKVDADGLKTPLITTQRHYTRPRVRENSGCWSSSRVNASISGCNQRSGIVGIRS